MIASLHGTVLDIAPGNAVIDCNGVGYLILATPRTLGQLRRGEEAFVLTHLAVKEDAMTLYGFATGEERRFFLLLQSVTGLGPKLALATVGTLSPEELAQAISAGDTKRLQSVPGIGKKVAERIAMELKDKVAEFAPQPTSSVAATNPNPAVAGQVVDALVGLGFSERQAEPVVTQVLAEHPESPVNIVLKAALTQLGKA
ncbi:Holliday junction branch migration protein RuvA [Corynebacterium tapiri]|uniref:Holliday junction branch migration complex subunit RuvA n=1 Tax=Corynebacterium tapiri TaxID=1448266 RepID=A0A5C4U3Z8_9CORY|nr:Holliday junction branch migration protein RuvA [Corynebacterium tapiri]TNL97745.1 Holliday junction branch migration protein RuvA [Corynebacterium tapiri]